MVTPTPNGSAVTLEIFSQYIISEFNVSTDVKDLFVCLGLSEFPSFIHLEAADFQQSFMKSHPTTTPGTGAPGPMVTLNAFSKHILPKILFWCQHKCAEAKYRCMTVDTLHTLNLTTLSLFLEASALNPFHPITSLPLTVSAREPLSHYPIFDKAGASLPNRALPSAMLPSGEHSPPISSHSVSSESETARAPSSESNDKVCHIPEVYRDRAVGRRVLLLQPEVAHKSGSAVTEELEKLDTEEKRIELNIGCMNTSFASSSPLQILAAGCQTVSAHTSNKNLSDLNFAHLHCPTKKPQSDESNCTNSCITSSSDSCDDQSMNSTDTDVDSSNDSTMFNTCPLTANERAKQRVSYRLEDDSDSECEEYGLGLSGFIRLRPSSIFSKMSSSPVSSIFNENDTTTNPGNKKRKRAIRITVTMPKYATQPPPMASSSSALPPSSHLNAAVGHELIASPVLQQSQPSTVAPSMVFSSSLLPVGSPQPLSRLSPLSSSPPASRSVGLSAVVQLVHQPIATPVLHTALLEKKLEMARCGTNLNQSRLFTITNITDNDVLLGKGGGTNKHAGNVRYRAVVLSFHERYCSVRRMEKSQITKQIIEEIWRRGGRFLESMNLINWREADVRQVIDKTTHACRDVHNSWSEREHPTQQQKGDMSKKRKYRGSTALAKELEMARHTNPN